jgi:hypothetical protein
VFLVQQPVRVWHAVGWAPAGQRPFPQPPHNPGLVTVAKTCAQPIRDQTSGDGGSVEVSQKYHLDPGVGLQESLTEALASNHAVISEAPDSYSRSAQCPGQWIHFPLFISTCQIFYNMRTSGTTRDAPDQ